MHEPILKVLLVEDDSAYALLLKASLSDVSARPLQWTQAQSAREALEKLQGERFDVVLMDLGLPDSVGLSTYSRAKASAVSVPVIVLTGNDNQETASQAVREGAQDYLVKGQFDGRTLARAIHYAIERKQAQEELRQREEFFRLISENVTDLIAVLDQNGHRIYNSPSYRPLLGNPDGLLGTDSFAEVHPEDRERIKQIFRDTVTTGIGHRAEYRMVLIDGSIRHIESQGSVIRDPNGKPSKVVVVSRDVTERREAVETLRQALSDLNQSHEQLKAAQVQLVEAEKLEAVSTFAGGVAHEVRNPLQTIILGADYFLNHLPTGDANAGMVLRDMAEAVHRADEIIKGLMEFSVQPKREVREEDLSGIMEQALGAVELEVMNRPLRLRRELAAGLPAIRVDGRTLKHVFINLLLYSVRQCNPGSRLTVRTFTRQWSPAIGDTRKHFGPLRPGDTVLGAEVDLLRAAGAEPSVSVPPAPVEARTAVGAANGAGLTVLKKIVETYGGVIEVESDRKGDLRYTVLFQQQKQAA